MRSLHAILKEEPTCMIAGKVIQGESFDKSCDIACCKMVETRNIAAAEIGDSSLPVSSLHLLVRPLQLLSAAMWQVLQQQEVLHYGKLEEFVSLVMEAFPELLSGSQRTELTLGLQMRFGFKTDPALEVLLWELLSRLNQLLPVPDLKQVVSWLSDAPSVLEVCVQSVSYIDQLKTLLRHHRSGQQLDKNETLPSLEEYKPSDMALPPSQQVVDSSILTNTNSQSQSINDCLNCFNPISLSEARKTESVMDSSDCNGAARQSALNRSEDIEERTQRKTGYLMSRTQEDVLTNMKKEEEDGESHSLKMEREDDERYGQGYRKEEEKQKEKWMEGNSPGQAVQTDNVVQNRVNSEHGQQEREGLFTLITSCLLKQPRVLLRRLENGSSSVSVSSPPLSMITPLRGNGSVRLNKDQVLTQRSKTVGQLERSTRDLPSSSEIRMCAEVSLSSPVVSSMEQNTGQAVEESSQVFSCSQCPSVHTEVTNLHQHIEKFHTEQLNRTLQSETPPTSTDQHPTSPKTLPTPTQSHTGTPGAHTCSQCGKSFPKLSKLKEHLRTHTGEQPYPCSQCGRCFTHLNTLKLHLRTHTDSFVSRKSTSNLTC